VVNHGHESHEDCRSGGDGVVGLDVSWLGAADLAAVDALARLQVVAARRGRRLRLHGADGGLAELVELVGLGEVLQLCPKCGATLRGTQP
jgi:ABC-type transporter Mla MlaB component